MGAINMALLTCILMNASHQRKHSINGAHGIMQYSLHTLEPCLYGFRAEAYFDQLLDLLIFSGEHKMQPHHCVFISGKEVDSKGMRSHCYTFGNTFLHIFCLSIGCLMGNLSVDAKASFVPMKPLTPFSHEQNY